MVYVDEPIWAFGNMTMCHLTAETEAELHAFAEQLGLKRKWFQPKSKPHYDICLSKRRLAIRYGAKEITIADRARKLREQRQSVKQGGGHAF